MTEVPSLETGPVPGLVSGPVTEADARRGGAVRWARGLSWLWLLPLVVLTAWVGYLSRLFTAFAAEALGGEVTWWVVVVAFGVPMIIAGAAAAAGVVVARTSASWAAGRRRLTRLPPWAIGAGTAVLGAGACAGVLCLAGGGARLLGL